MDILQPPSQQGHFLLFPCCTKVMPKHVLVTRHRSHVCMWVCYARMPVNGNQVLLCFAKTGLLLHRQRGVSRSSLMSSAGPLTSNAPLMADKLIGLGQAGQQMGTFTFEGGAEKDLSVLLGPTIGNPGQVFSWDVKRKRVSALWEGNKTWNPWLVKGAACLKKKKKDLREVKNDKGRWKETCWCDVITFP